MKLDSRIIEGKKPLTCFDTEIAKRFIGKECYSANSYLSFRSLDGRCIKGWLFDINEKDEVFPFIMADRKDTGKIISKWSNSFIIPVSWTKEQEKPKYRPYTREEFVNSCNMGTVMCYRFKDEPETVYQQMITDMEFPKNTNTVRMRFATGFFDLEELFEEIEIKTEGGNKDVWVPFGVEE